MWFVDVFVKEGEVKPSAHSIDVIVGDKQKTKQAKMVSVVVSEKW
jgi:hypothetical protein